MNTNLTKEKCVPRKAGVQPLTAAEYSPLLPQIPGWRVLEIDDHDTLVNTYRLKDFAAVVEEVVRIKDLAENEGHHPDLHISFNVLRIEIWTHAIKGLHQNDFILAAKIDQLLPRPR